MRVFVTGASGWVGSAVVPELIDAGHHVVGLARSDASAQALESAGAEVRRGSLEDIDSLRAGAADSDGVIHLAFIHDFNNYDDANQTDRHAIEAMGAVLEGSHRPLVIASGVATTAVGRPAREDDPPAPEFPRSEASTITVGLAARGVRSAVVRLPPTVHGRGDEGFIKMLIEIARQTGVSGYVGDGSNRWPAVHRSDAARVFHLALEQARAGAVYHAVGEEGVVTRAIADTIGRHLNVPVEPVPAEDAMSHFGWIGLIWAVDVPTASAWTRAHLGWNPTGVSLLDDVEAGHYFDDPTVPGAGT